MIVKFREGTKKEEIEIVRTHLLGLGFDITENPSDTYILFNVFGDTALFDVDSLYAFKCVETVLRVQEPFKRVSRKWKAEDTVVDVGGVRIGGNEVILIAGPCAVENPEQIDLIARKVQAAGAKILRAGAYKPRTSPYSFQGLEKEGLALLKAVRAKYRIPIASEIMSLEDLPLFLDAVDLLQVGARNMQNFPLLKELGKTDRPVLLKRGMANTIEEWLMSAEYILAGGNPNVILCERGIRTFEPATRATLDLSAVPVLKSLSHLPVIVDPSHAAGRWEYIESLSRAAIAAGADGLMIEVHPDPEKALSDGQQSLKPERFADLAQNVRRIAGAVGRTLK